MEFSPGKLWGLVLNFSEYFLILVVAFIELIIFAVIFSVILL